MSVDSVALEEYDYFEDVDPELYEWRHKLSNNIYFIKSSAFSI